MRKVKKSAPKKKETMTMTKSMKMSNAKKMVKRAGKGVKKVASRVKKGAKKMRG